MRAHGLLNADLASTLCHRHQHDVHQANAADSERQQPDKAQKNLDSDCNHGEIGEILHSVEDEDSAIVLGIEVVMKSHRVAHGRHHLAVVALVIHHDAVEIVAVLEVAHGAVWHVDQRVHVLVAIGNGMAKNSDDFVGDAVDSDALAQRVLAGEKFLLHRGPDNGYARVSKVFALSEERAFAHVECANFLVRRIDSMNAIARATSAKCDQALLVDFRRNTGEHGTLGTNKVEIIAREPHLHAGFCPSRLDRSTSRKNRHQVAPEGAEGNHQSVLEAGAVGKQQNNRRDTPCHAKHGEQGAAAIVFQRVECLLAQFAKHDCSRFLLLLPQCFHWRQQRGFTRGIKSRHNACNRKRNNRHHGGRRHNARRIEPFRRRQLRQQSYERSGDGQSDAAAEHGKECAFDKKLRHDIAMGGAQSLAQANLSRSLGDGDQHDVDDADRAQAKSNESHDAQKIIHRVKNLSHANGAVDGIPVIEGIVKTGIEKMPPRDDAVNLVFGLDMQLFFDGTVINERDCILRVLRLQREKHSHGVEGYKDAMVGSVFALFADLWHDADDFEIHVIEQNRAADGRFAGEHVLQQFPSHHGHATMLFIVLCVKPASRIDWHVANIAVLGNHAENLSIRRSVIADRTDIVALQDGGHGAQKPSLVTDGEVVSISQVIRLS